MDPATMSFMYQSFTEDSQGLLYGLGQGVAGNTSSGFAPLTQPELQLQLQAQPGAATTGVQYYAQVPIRYPNATPLQYAAGQYLAGEGAGGSALHHHASASHGLGGAPPGYEAAPNEFADAARSTFTSDAFVFFSNGALTGEHGLDDGRLEPIEEGVEGPPEEAWAFDKSRGPSGGGGQSRGPSGGGLMQEQGIQFGTLAYGHDLRSHSQRGFAPGAMSTHMQTILHGPSALSLPPYFDLTPRDISMLMSGVHLGVSLCTVEALAVRRSPRLPPRLRRAGAHGPAGVSAPAAAAGAGAVGKYDVPPLSGSLHEIAFGYPAKPTHQRRGSGSPARAAAAALKTQTDQAVKRDGQPPETQHPSVPQATPKPPPASHPHPATPSQPATHPPGDKAAIKGSWVDRIKQLDTTQPPTHADKLPVGAAGPLSVSTTPAQCTSPKANVYAAGTGSFSMSAHANGGRSQPMGNALQGMRDTRGGKSGSGQRGRQQGKRGKVAPQGFGEWLAVQLPRLTNGRVTLSLQRQHGFEGQQKPFVLQQIEQLLKNEPDKLQLTTRIMQRWEQKNPYKPATEKDLEEMEKKGLAM